MPTEQKDTHEWLTAMKALEPLPATVARLASLLAASDWDMDDVEECVALDQTLTPRLLRIANSPQWYRGRDIVTVREAVMRMGSGAVVAFAVGAGVQRRFARALPRFGMREGELWRHSVAAALATTVLDGVTDAAIPAEAFTAALLHDLGKLVITRVLDASGPTSGAIRITEPVLAGGEIELNGLDHAALGGVAAVHWRLPDRIMNGITFHHAPEATEDSIASVVQLADVVAHRAEVLVDLELVGRSPKTPSTHACDLLGVTPEALERCAIRVGDQLADVLRRYT